MQLITSTTLLISLLAWIASTEAYKCELPKETFNFSLITKDDAAVGAKSMYLGVAVGGTLSDTTPEDSATFDKTRSCVGSLDPNNRFNFNAGLSNNCALSSVVDFGHYEWLARNAVSSSSADGKKVIVVDSGGTFDMFDFNNGGQGEDNGKTLVIFDTEDDIYLDATSDNRQFGPSVIAPRARVFLYGNAAFVDGIVVAKEFATISDRQNQLQLHGDAYTGDIECLSASTSPPTGGPSSAPTSSPSSSPTSMEERDEHYLCM
jgi:hypothetical protein